MSEQVLSLGDHLKDSLRRNIRQYVMVLALLSIWAIFTPLTGGIFLGSVNLTNLALQCATTAILAIGMTMVIVTGHIDLSVGSVLGFSGAVGVLSMVDLGWGLIPSILASLFAGALIGAWHGWWVAYRRVPAFIVTLASMLAFRGAMLLVTGGASQGLEKADSATAEAYRAISNDFLPQFDKSLPFHDATVYLAIVAVAVYVFFSLRRRKARLAHDLPVLPMRLEVMKLVAVGAAMGIAVYPLATYHGVPWSFLIVIGAVLAVTFIATRTTFGRHLYAIGGNPEAARLSGIDVRKKTLGMFVMMGTLTGLAAVLYASRNNGIQGNAGTNAELDAITASVIGGTSLMGGQGTIFGAVIGAFVMASLDSGMQLLNTNDKLQLIIKGLVLLLAVWVDVATRKKA